MATSSSLGLNLVRQSNAFGTFSRACLDIGLTTLPNHLHQILGAFAVYEALFAVVSPLASKYLLKGWIKEKYDTLNRRTRANWDVRVVSFVQSVFISGQALRVIYLRGRSLNNSSGTIDSGYALARTWDTRQRLWGYDYTMGSVQAYAAGYFLWDLYVSVRHLDILGPGSLIHAVCALGISILGFRPFANYYGINFVLYEISTPFLGIHWWLDKLEMTGSTLQLANGFALMASFFGCRLAWGMYQTVGITRDAWSAWSEYCATDTFLAPSIPLLPLGGEPTGLVGQGSPTRRFPTGLLALYLVANTTLSVLNTHWFSKMVQALRKRFEAKNDDHNGRDLEKAEKDGQVEEEVSRTAEKSE